MTAGRVCSGPACGTSSLRTAPAPYALTAVTYDPRNLPLTLTRGGVTTASRYEASGQRITKRVGSGATEVYVLDEATTLGVVTLNASGTPTAWHFNVLAGERVIGRAPHTGARRHYHTDLLGSTRAVVAGTTILESVDYDPWGVALAGRSLGGGTKEGFTGKERDAESGLDHFGARAYLPAIGRWGSVDPLAELYPAWSPYNYVRNDPNRLTGPDGRNPLFGALRGAAVELAFQAYDGEFDGTDVVISAAAGAASSGLSAVSQGLRVGQRLVAGAFFNGTSNVAEGFVKSRVGDATAPYGIGQAGIDWVTGAFFGASAEGAPEVLRRTQAGQQLVREVRRLSNVAAEGSPRSAQSQRAREATSRLESFGQGPTAQTTALVGEEAAARVAAPDQQRKTSPWRVSPVLPDQTRVAPRP